MTFDNLVTEVKDRLGLSSSEATTRIGREVNTRHRRITSAPWLDPLRRTTRTAVTSIDSAEVIFQQIERIERVRNENTTPWTNLYAVTYDELGRITLDDGDSPSRYAVKSMTATSITILLDTLPQTSFTLKADGIATVPTLSGNMEPYFPESFHDCLIEGAIADELRRMEKDGLAEQSEALFLLRLADLKAFVTQSYDLASQGGIKKRILE